MSPEYQPVKHSRLSEEIVEQIEKLVLSKELRVGYPLPSERELARRFQVSRQALREAMRILVQKGLVQVHPGRGTFVAQPCASFLSDPLHTYLCLNPHLARDFLESRLVIETETAFMAAERATDDNLLAIKRALEDLEASLAYPNGFIEADLNFHTELAQATGNQVLALLVVSLRGALRESIRYFASKPEIVDQSPIIHRRIYDAVAARKSEAARQAMREHFRLTLDEVTRGLPPIARPGPDLSSD